ncbi:MAG: hypothetical protein LZF60_80333 [Nitrospira sp.]|nr:MAG: hypothetical protein LZF60_80333 [Nitrospira sp.]
MVHRTAEVTVQGNECSGAAGDAAPPSTPVPCPEQILKDPDGSRCPVQKCDGRMKVCAAEYDSRSGLESLVCTKCKHRGLRSREGVIPLFRGGHEFKFSYGPSTRTVTVVLSSAAVNLWGTHGVNEEQVAKLAAEWTLLCGNTKKPVQLGLPSEEFADFYLYFCGK